MGKRSRDSASPPVKSPAIGVDASEGVFVDMPVSKAVAIDQGSVSEDSIMQCSLPPHTASLRFLTLRDFESHYTQEHTNRCVACGRNLPSSHYLNLHQEEMHNPLREALAVKGEKTYSCLLEDCERKCSTPQKRRLHMIDKHAFPRMYNFRVIETGIDGTSSMLRENRRRRVSVMSDLSMQAHRSLPQSPSDQQHLADVEPICKEATPGQSPVRCTGDVVSQYMHAAVAERRALDIDVCEIEESFAAMHFVPRKVMSRRHAQTHSETS